PRSAFYCRQSGARPSARQRRSAPHLRPVHERNVRGCRAPSSRLPTGKKVNRRTDIGRSKMALSDSAEVMETVAKERFLRKSPFLEFCDAEGLPVITGYGVEDLRKVPLSHWDRLGGPAAYCHLEGSQGFVGSMVAEIPP